jgi:amidase
MSASEQFGLIARGQLSTTEVRDAGIARCAELDGPLGFLAAGLEDRAPPGVPMLLKDAGQELAGTPHFVGVAALRDAGHTSRVTTALAARFEQAGFSVVGKATCPALASGVTTEPRGFAPTRNPWDRDLSPGGSSGGSAAAVTAGAVPVAHGSDATGSLRFPAALCGLVTLVPTAGIVPSVPPAGQPANAAWRDFVLARCVEDVVLVHERLVGPVEAPPPGRLRVGVLDHDPELGLDVHPECRRAVHMTAAWLEQLGHVVDTSWPAALDHLWQRCAAAFAVGSDATRPPTLRWLAERLGRPLAPGDVDDDVVAAARRDETREEADRATAAATIAAAVAPIESWWDDHDVLVTPATFQPAWPLGGRPGPAECGTLAAPFSLTGQPAMSVPVHRTPAGLPVGAQLVARHGGDAVLLALAAQLEQLAGWRDAHPG